MLFCKAAMVENERIMKLLEIYEKASSQQINKLKTSMHFSKNVKVKNQQKIKEFWGFCWSQSHDWYLELPPIVYKYKLKVFSNIKYKVWKKNSKDGKRNFCHKGEGSCWLKWRLYQSQYTLWVVLNFLIALEVEKIMAKFWWEQKKERVQYSLD